jgi:hypothetical protein
MSDPTIRRDPAGKKYDTLRLTAELKRARALMRKGERIAPV